MAFVQNNDSQISMDDKVLNMTEREQKFLKKSWAWVFFEEIFQKIDEEPFSVIYSGNKASRPNSPVNVTISALILKEMFDLSDDELIEEIMFDSRYQTALGTTSRAEQPVSDKTFTRFRNRCLAYQAKTGKDLISDCMGKLSSSIAKVMKISGSTRRMDSMMIDSNIKKLSRFELVYSCVARFVSHIHKTDETAVPDGMSHYLDKDDYNNIFYHEKPSEQEESMASILEDAAALLELSEDPRFAGTDCDIFRRCISEQTIEEDGKRRFLTKEDGIMSSDLLQSPTDADATYRVKAGKEHRGYAANFEESVGENGSVITDYDFECNNYSDSRFLKDNLASQEVNEETVTLVADGAYDGEENGRLAKEKNVNLVTTGLAGKSTRDIAADFEFNEDGTEVLRCPAGYTPDNCCFDKSVEACVLSFPRDLCANCPHKDECKAKIHKRKANVRMSRKEHDRAKQQREMQSESFKNISRFRNGVESIPSVLRRRYNLNKLPRGKARAKLFFGFKIGAFNFRKLFDFRNGTGNYAPNPVIG